MCSWTHYIFEKRGDENLMSILTHQKRLSRFRRSISEANKIALLFQYFWNMIFDKNPLYCFSCGKYIPVHQRTAEFFKIPYKDKVIHNDCWEALPSDNFVKRLNEDSLLICHLDLGWGVHGSVCRIRVKNNPTAIIKHLIIYHGWKQIPELVQNDIKNGKILKKQYVVTIKENPEQWFLDNQLIWSDFRNIHFLKPNGKSFPKVRDY